MTSTSTTINWDTVNFGGTWHDNNDNDSNTGTGTSASENYDNGGDVLIKDTSLPDDDATSEPTRFDRIINTQRIASNPEIVGEVNWNYLHMLTLRYPVQPTQDDMADMEEYLNSFFQHMGCVKKCAKHVMDYTQEHPVPLSSRAELVWWAWGLHNDVNRRAGKSFFSREQFIRRYITDMARKGETLTWREATTLEKWASTIGFIVFVIIGIFVVRWLWNRKEHFIMNNKMSNAEIVDDNMEEIV